MTRIPDTSKRGTRADRGLPVMRRWRPALRVFFAFVGRKVTAPTGYAFNHRGDLINLRKRRKYGTGAA